MKLAIKAIDETCSVTDVHVYVFAPYGIHVFESSNARTSNIALSSNRAQSEVRRNYDVPCINLQGIIGMN